MENETVYEIDHNLELCKLRLKEENSIPGKVKDAILEFVDDMAIKGRSKHRQYFYIERLKIMARIMGEKFLSPDKDDVRKAMLKLRGGGAVIQERYSERTISDIIQVMKTFYSTYQDGKFKNAVEWLEVNNHASRQKKPEDIITKEEINSLLNACVNERDKCLIAMAYDSGGRIGELLTLKVRDVVYDSYGMKLTVSGKTGVRTIRVVGDSVYIARDYQKKYGRTNPDDFFFVQIEGKGSTGPMKYSQFHSMLNKVKKRAGITKRIHSHLFRHTRATLLATSLTEAPLESTMGWVHGSRMSRVYVHLSDDVVDNAVLKVYGITKKDDGNGLEYVPRVCMRCGKENPKINDYCSRCGMPLDRKKMVEFEREKREARELILNSNVINEGEKEILRNTDQDSDDIVMNVIYKLAEMSPETLKGLVSEEKNKL